MSLRSHLVELDGLVAELTPPQREAMRTASVQIAAALTNLGTAVPDGVTGPIASCVQAVLLAAATTWRPGKGFAGFRPKLAAALEECPTLRVVAGEFLAKLAPLPPVTAALLPVPPGP